MATIYKCDRCGTPFEKLSCDCVTAYNKKGLRIDLCGHCQEMFEAFLHWEPMACEVDPKPTVEDKLKDIAEQQPILDWEIELGLTHYQDFLDWLSDEMELQAKKKHARDIACGAKYGCKPGCKKD